MIYRRPPLRQASLDHPCSKTGAHIRSVALQETAAWILLFQRVVFTGEQFEGLRHGDDCTIPSVLLLFQTGMRFGWPLLAVTQTFSLAPAGSGSLCRRDTLPRTALCGSVAGCFSTLTNVSGQTACGPCRPLWSDHSGAAECSFLARKVSLNWVWQNFPPCVAEPHPAGMEPPLRTKRRKELCSSRSLS